MANTQMANVWRQVTRPVPRPARATAPPHAHAPPAPTSAHPQGRDPVHELV